MSTWTADELNKIGNADELRLATARPDGSLRNPVTIWVVRHGDDLYIRSYRGPGGCWFRRARERRDGRIQAGGVDKDVTFADSDHGLDDHIDAAYRAKYGRHSGTYVDPMVAPPGAGDHDQAPAPHGWHISTPDLLGPPAQMTPICARSAGPKRDAPVKGHSPARVKLARATAPARNPVPYGRLPVLGEHLRSAG